MSKQSQEKNQPVAYCTTFSTGDGEEEASKKKKMRIQYSYGQKYSILKAVFAMKQQRMDSKTIAKTLNVPIKTIYTIVSNGKKIEDEVLQNSRGGGSCGGGGALLKRIRKKDSLRAMKVLVSKKLSAFSSGTKTSVLRNAAKEAGHYFKKALLENSEFVSNKEDIEVLKRFSVSQQWVNDVVAKFIKDRNRVEVGTSDTRLEDTQRSPKGTDLLFYIEADSKEVKSMECNCYMTAYAIAKAVPLAVAAFFRNTNVHKATPPGFGHVTIQKIDGMLRLGIVVDNSDCDRTLLLLWKGQYQALFMPFEVLESEKITDLWEPLHVRCDRGGWLVSKVYGIPTVMFNEHSQNTSSPQCTVSPNGPDFAKLPTREQLPYLDQTCHDVIYIRENGLRKEKERSGKQMGGTKIYTIPGEGKDLMLDGKLTGFRLVEFIDVDIKVIQSTIKDGMLFTDFIKNLKSEAVKVYELLIPSLSQPTRLKLLSPEEFQDVLSEVDKKKLTYYKHTGYDGNAVEMLFGEEVGDLMKNRGVLLAAIASDPTLEEVAGKHANFKSVMKLIKSYGKVGHNRECSGHLGLATYRSKRSSSRPHPRPSQNPTEVREHQYFSNLQQTNPMLQNLMEQLIKELGLKAEDFMVKYQGLFGVLVQGVCDKRILTTGISSEVTGSKGKKYLSFCCESHCDTADVVKCEELSNKNEYLRALQELLGEIGLPTSCQYFHVWKDTETKANYEVNSYFIHRGLGIAHPLKHMDGVTFLGFAYTHCTSFCYLTTRDRRKKVVASNDLDDIFSMVAWGNSGGKAEYTRASSRKRVSVVEGLERVYQP